MVPGHPRVDKHEVVEAGPAALAGAGAWVLSDRHTLGKIANLGSSEKAAREVMVVGEAGGRSQSSLEGRNAWLADRWRPPRIVANSFERSEIVLNQ